MWDKINVWQYQQIYNALNSKEKDATERPLTAYVTESICDSSDLPNLRPHITTLKRLSHSSIFCWFACGLGKNICIIKWFYHLQR